MDLDTLERLVKLRDSGALNQAEFLQQKRLLEKEDTPPLGRVPKPGRLPKASIKTLGLAAAGIVTVLVITSLIQNKNTGSGLSASYRPPASTGYPATGTATAKEREAYSHDLYDRPSGLSAESQTRYESLSSEGQEYVDEQMARYDAACARSNAC